MFIAFSFDNFGPLLETGGDARSFLVFLFLRPLSTVFALSLRPAKLLAAFSCSLFGVLFRRLFSPALNETDGNARNAFVLLRLTVKRVIELLIRILPSYQLSDASV